MRRRINFRLLLITVAVLGVVGALFHGIHVWQVNRNAASLLDYAREAKREKKTDQAVQLYDQYLKQVPRDRDAQEELALLLDSVARNFSDRRRVVQLLETLLLKSGDRPDARKRLVQNLIFLGRYDAAVRHLDVLKAAARNPLDIAQYEHERGWCLDAEGKADAAAVSFQKAVDLDPKRINSWALLAEVLHYRLSKDVDALQALDKMVSANPDNAYAHLARFRYHHTIGRETEAVKDLARARQLDPNDANVILSACQWAQSKGDSATARDLVAKGIKDYPDNESMIRELAMLELRQGRSAAALKVLQEGLEKLKDKTSTAELQVLEADLLIDEGKLKDAAAAIADLRSQGMRPALPDFLQARLDIQAKKWAPALSLLEKSRTAIGSDAYWNGRINALIGVCYGQLGDGDRQIASLLDAAKSEPRWTALNLSLGQAFLAADNPEKALQYLQPLENDPDAPPLARVLLARTRFKLTLGQPMKERRWSEVDDAIALAEEKNPNSTDLVLLRAEVLEAQRRIDAARGLLTRKIKKLDKAEIDYLPLWIGLADLDARAGDFERADSTLADAEKHFGDAVATRLAKARLLVLRGRADDLGAIKALADGADAFSPEERGRLDRDLADVALRQGDTAAAQILLTRAAAEMPRDLRCRAQLLELALTHDNLEAARKWLKEMEAIEGKNGPQTAFAALLLQVEDSLGQPETLKRLLGQLKNSTLRKGDGRLELVEARILERLGRTDESLEKTKTAIAAGIRSPAVMRRYVQTLTERRQYDQLAWALSLYEGRTSLPKEMGRAAVEAALASGNIDQAADLLGPIDLSKIRDYRELLWLAKTYQAIGDDSRAEQALRRGIVVAPHAPDAWVALAEYFQIHSRPLTDDLILEIDRKAPKLMRSLIRARCLEAIGESDAAAAAYQAAIADRPGDFALLIAAADFFRQADQPKLAEGIYIKLLSPSMATPAELAARARRGLAQVLPPTEGLALFSATRGDVANERVCFFLEGQDPAQRPAAIRKFEESQSRGPFSAEEMFLLAQLQDSAGQSEAAAAAMNLLIVEDRATPAMLAFTVRLLERRGETDQARRVLDKFLDREPNSPRALSLQKLLVKK